MISKCSNPHVKRFHPENIQEASVQWNFLYLCSNHKSCSYLWPIWVLFMVVHGRSPPVRIGIGGTLTNTNSSIPRASPWPKLCELSYESCIGPIDLDSSSHLQLPSCHRPKCWHKLSFLAHWDKLSPCSGSSGKHELEHYQCTTWKCI